MAQRYRMKVPAHAHPLVKQLIEHMNDRDLRKFDVADRAGVYPKSLSDWSKGATPSLGNFEAVCNAVGLRLALVPADKVAR